MFGRLKRKRDDEEEAPLVPHGFLWQATDEPGNPDEDQEQLAKPATFEDNQSTSEEVAMPANATPQPESSSPRKLGAISPPLQWPSPHIQEIARHPETRPVLHASQLTSEQPKQEPALVEAPAANAISEEIISPPAMPSVAAREQEAAVSSEQIIPSEQKVSSEQISSEQIKNWGRAFSASLHSVRSSCGSFAKAVSSEISRAIVSSRTELHDLAERVNLKRRVVNARHLAATSLSNLHQRSRGISATAGKKLGALQQAATLRAQSRLTKSAERIRAIDFSWAARNLERARNLKITVRIPRRNSTRITAALSGVSMPWSRVRRSMNRDSRLWTSMAMAGLSALIALAVVSGLSRYQPGGSAGVVAAQSPGPATSAPRVSPNSEVLPTNKSAVAPIAPAIKNVVTSTAAQRPSPVVPKQAEASVQPTKLATLKSSTPSATKASAAHKPKRAHYSEDDDYIAKDTYVVYGRNGKPVRR